MAAEPVEWHGGRILVIDDDQAIWEVYRSVLAPFQGSGPVGRRLEGLLGREETGGEGSPPFRLSFAAQGEEGLAMVEQALAEEKPFALACIDMRMPPGWDGLTTAAAIRAADPDIELVIITAYSDHGREEIVRKVGAPDKLLILKKPFDPDELAQLATALTTKWHLCRQQKEHQKQLAASEERYRTVFAASVDGLCIFQADEQQRPRIVDMNESFVRLSGRSREELLACEDVRSLQQPLMELGSAGCCFGRQAGGHSCQAVFSWLRPDGRTNIVECRGTPIRLGLQPAVLCVHRDITAARKAQQRISQLSRRLVHVVEEERKRIALDLHDEFGQLLPPLQFAVKTVRDQLPSPMLAEKSAFANLEKLVGSLGVTCRNMLTTLRPEMLDQLGLISTIKWGINEFMVQHRQTVVDFSVVGVEKQRDPDIDIVLYRIFQEGINNIGKHALASRVEVMLTFSYPHVILTMIDNGRGFEVEAVNGRLDFAKGGMGLAGMRERAASVGGRLTIRSRPGKGTMLRAKLPVK